MKKTFFLFVLTLLVTASGAEAVRTKYNVLYLNSYENGYAWSDNILSGIRSAIRESGMVIDLQIEYLDAKKYYDDRIDQALFEYYRYKFRNTRFDAVIVSDNIAFRFIRHYQDRLVPGVPIVFCGLNDFRQEMVGDRKDITGVVETIRVREILEMALSLHPGTGRLIVIDNESATARAIVNDIRQALPPFYDRLKVEFRTGFDRPDFFRRLREITPDAIVFMVPFYEDIYGEYYSAREVLTRVYETVNVPIYSCWEFLIGYGIIGGRLTSGAQHGREAAGIAIRILKGAHPSQIPIVTRTDDASVFDYNVLTRFGISTDLLPPGSRIINEPYRFYRLAREVVWVLMGSFAVLIVITGFLVINIVQRRSAETKYRSIFENAIEGIFIADLDGHFIDVNRAFARILGYHSEEKALEHINRIGHSYAMPERREEFWRRMRNGEKLSGFEMGYIRRDGSVSWVMLKANPVYDKNGNIIHVEGTAEDITRQKQAEKALTESRQTLRLILDNIPQLVCWKDRNFRYMGVNRSFMSILGISDPRSFIGRDDEELPISKAFVRRLSELDRRVMETNTPSSMIKLSFEKSPNEFIWLEINKIPLQDENGQPFGILSTGEDITRRVSLEKQLRQSQKMEALGILSGGIAHDFNNILTSIINSAELAIEDIPEGSVTRRDMERVLRAAGRGSQLVQQILTFSRPTREGFQTIDIKEVVSDALELIKASLPGNIRVSERIYQGPGLCVADPTQIHQIVMNLCTNSIQALGERGGQLEITLEKCDVKTTLAEMLSVVPGNFWKLTVSDNGPGIPAGIMEKIFDPFFTTKAKGEGTGLGLAMVHGIVTGHKGAIAVKSLARERVSFEIYLPRERTEEVSPEPDPALSHQGRERILFVEDDEDQREIIPRVLGQLGYDVVSARNAADALEAFSGNGQPFDLVITDFDMPETSGFELATEIGKRSPGTPVLIVSGRDRATRIEACGNIRKIISKPYNKAVIAEAIRDILD
ncbi:hypothetical protein DENIS_1074 [Desulfonema ishimotonii]|uniref:histidine kinase n=1 Tax=Desulfonema ishimotonii TaxID=45657 RepID=A0A401FT37_9BACT|nr:PAS domain S-box protein [Desulfonema ishimotonii]GBC60129.1 hypothetical protein DENIS_1074 [Desulfonema ishimotonii]